MNDSVYPYPQNFLLTGLFFCILFFGGCQPGEKGPGGPILVVSDIAKNPFSRYTTEILRAEGLNEFDVAEIGDISARTLTNYDVVLLGNIPISAERADLLSEWVKSGGILIAFRPDARIHSLFGIEQKNPNILPDKYLLVNHAIPEGVGIVNETIQYHGESEMYTMIGAISLATLYSDAITPTNHPAVTSNNFGAGKAIAFAYDLPRSVVYTRQGNPAWQGQKRDTTGGPIRSNDLFINNSKDSLHDYIDFDKIAIPQADEQQRFLCNIILKANVTGKPLPRFWYLPKSLKAAVVMTGDDHDRSGTIARFDKYLKNGPNTYEDIRDWNAVRATSYIYTNNLMSDEQAKFYQDQGFEIALHLSTHCADWTPKTLDDEWVAQVEKFEEKYPDLSIPVSNRTHCMCWSDWSSQAKVQAQHGVRLDVNYYYWPGQWVKNRPGLFTGSAIPMRFADIDGSIIDCYQAPTQITDESDVNFTTFTNQLLDRAIGKEGYYGVFVANMHTDIANHTGSDIIVESARKRNVPVISARQLLTWLEGRNNSSFGSLTWNGENLSFYILAAPGSDNMKTMLPLTFKSEKLISIKKDGSPVRFTTEIIKGINYAFFDAITGNYTATYEEDAKGPVIRDIVAEPQQDGTVEIKWVTDEPSDSRVDFGITGIQMTMNKKDALPKYNHSLKLSGLFPGTAYQFRISSADEAGNISTETPINEVGLSFTMPGPVIIDEKHFAVLANGTSSYLSESNGGELTLRPNFSQHFSGRSLPAGTVARVKNKGAVSVSNGDIKINGAEVFLSASFVPGSVLEFESVFTKERGQQVAFVGNNKFDSLSITIGTNDSLNGIYAKAGKGPEVLLLYANEFGSPHQYRIEWKATRFVFFVDGIESATIENTVTGKMSIALRDSIVNGTALSAGWIEVSPYSLSASTYTSGIYDAGSVKNWDMISWTADIPKGTAVKIFYRNGNTPVIDRNWSDFMQVINSGEKIHDAVSRYIQYKVELSTDDLNISPAFKEIKISAGISQ